MLENENVYNLLIECIDDLLFENIQNFESEHTQNDVLNNWEDEVGFNSYRRAYIHENGLPLTNFDIDLLPIPDEVLSTLLNPDKILQINPWIFKLQPETKKVYVLSTENKSLLSTLISEDNFTDISEIQEFSFDDEVFALLESGRESEVLLSCKKAKGDVDEVGSEYCSTDMTDWKYELKAKYDRFGIKEHLWFRFQHKDGNAFDTRNDPTFYDIRYQGHYTPKCRSIVNFDVGYSTATCFSTGMPFRHLIYFGRNDKFTVYNNSRALEEYYLEVNGRFLSRCRSTTGVFFGSQGICVPSASTLSTGSVVINQP